jgi:putative tricarboxylic transport membrane protein
MELSMLDAAGSALLLILEPTRLMYLAIGVLIGLALGIMPGVGGIAGMALLLPFTFNMDHYAAFGLLLGMGAVTTTSDTIPAVLFGVPGTAGSQATVLDGFPMTKKGEAGRALAAAYTASLIGGLFGAFILAITIPILRPVILYLGSPELLAFALFGISMVAILSGNAPLRGLAAACLGLMLSMIGTDPQSGTLRWTMDSLYLWDGLPLVPMVLGVFALPELCDLAIKRSAIASQAKFDVKTGMLRGCKDALENWWLIMRCGSLGAAVGALPGIGASVIDWLAYGHAVQTEKNAQTTFGTGDVRGVIAPESANNAKEGGALVPTIAFGVPGTASMAILLGAFLIHGLVPGPEMLTKNLAVTYSMVWSIAIANILGAGICFAFSGQLAKLATFRYTLVLPTVLGIMFVGAYQASRQWGDLYTLFGFGLLGWTMKRLLWPRPPLVLGFVLGSTIERYMFISIERYGLNWLTRPVVIALLTIAIYTLLRPFFQDVKIHGGWKNMLSGFGRPRFHLTDAFYAFWIGLVVIMLVQASAWDYSAKVVPMIVGVFGLTAAIISLLNQSFRVSSQAPAGVQKAAREAVQQKIHMDLQSDDAHLTAAVVMKRAAIFFVWIAALMGSMAVIGLIPTIAVFVVMYMRLEGREPWHLVLPQAFGLPLLIYVVFDQLLSVPWPPTIIGGLFPALKIMPSV